MRLRPALLAALLAACTNPLVPSDNLVLLRVDLGADGEVDDLTATLTPPGEVPRYAQPTDEGDLRVEIRDGDEIVWSGARRISRQEVDEVFLEDGTIEGTPSPRERMIVYLSYPDDGRSRATVHLSFTTLEGTVVESDVTVDIARPDPVAGSAAPLVIRGDVGARREALACDPAECEADEFCVGNSVVQVCLPEACLPTDDFDNATTVLEAGSDRTLVLVPNGWSSADEFETYAQQLVDDLHDRVDWFSENRGRIGFSVFRGDCHYQDMEPDQTSTTDLLNWLRGGGDWAGLPVFTRNLPPADGYIVVSASGNCRGRATRPGEWMSLTRCERARSRANDLGHELGHMIAGLGDEYAFADDRRDTCGGPGDEDRDRIFTTPNVAPSADPHWFCPSDAGEIYAGQACPLGGIVGSVVSPANICSSGVARPCDDSIMGSADGDQFDPVGAASMTYALDTGAVMGYEDCDRGCDPDCTGVPEGTCALNACNTICDACAEGERCRGTVSGSFSCGAECPGNTPCVSDIGYEVCDGSASLIQDAACEGTGIRLAECNDGDFLTGECLMP